MAFYNKTFETIFPISTGNLSKGCPPFERLFGESGEFGHRENGYGKSHEHHYEEDLLEDNHHNDHDRESNSEG